MYIYTDGIQQNLNKNTFGSRNESLKKAYDVCRCVKREFPVVSNTRLVGFSSINYTTQNQNFLSYIRDVVVKYREYYDKNPCDIRHKFMKEMSGMKNLRVGNCGEMADATCLALKLNGINDVKRLHLYAYNKVKKTMRDLDHALVGVDFKLPKNYKYHNFSNSEKAVNPKCRIYPQNNSIIVDTWMGFAEFGKQVESIYKSDKALLEGSKKGIHGNQKSLLSKDEELCYVPVKDYYNFKKKDFNYYEQKYPNLMLNKAASPQNAGFVKKLLKPFVFVINKTKNITKKRDFIIAEISPEIKDELRFKHSLKAAPTAEEMNNKKQKFMGYVNHKYHIKNPIKN